MLQSHLSSKGRNQPTKPHPHPRFVSRCHPALAPKIFPWRQFIPHPISPISRSPSGQACRCPAWFFSFAVALPAHTHSNALYMRDTTQTQVHASARRSRLRRCNVAMGAHRRPSLHLTHTHNLPTLGDRSLPVVFQTFCIPGGLRTINYRGILLYG